MNESQFDNNVGSKKSRRMLMKVADTVGDEAADPREEEEEDAESDRFGASTGVTLFLMVSWPQFIRAYTNDNSKETRYRKRSILFDSP